MANITLKLQDREGNLSNLKTVAVNFQSNSGFRLGVTPAGNDDRFVGQGGSPAAVRWSYDKDRAALKRDLAFGLKMFGSGGIQDAVDKWNALPKIEYRPTFTNEVWDPTALDNWMDTLTFDVGYCYRQEFMDKTGPGKAMSWATYNQRIAAIDAQVKAHPNGHFVECQLIGNEAIERTASSPVWPNVDVPDGWAIGNDTYIGQPGQLIPSKGAKGTTDWFNARKADTPGVKCRISEWAFASTFSISQKITALHTFVDYFKAQGFSSATYWAVDNTSEGTGHDYSIDKPGSEPFAAELASLIG